MSNVTLRRVRESFLLWKNNVYYILVCVCVPDCVSVCMRVRVCSLSYVAYHATRMRHVVMSFVATLAPPYSSTLSINGTNFEKKKELLNIKCVLIFSTT